MIVSGGHSRKKSYALNNNTLCMIHSIFEHRVIQARTGGIVLCRRDRMMDVLIITQHVNQ